MEIIKLVRLMSISARTALFNGNHTVLNITLKKKLKSQMTNLLAKGISISRTCGIGK